MVTASPLLPNHENSNTNTKTGTSYVCTSCTLLTRSGLADHTKTTTKIEQIGQGAKAPPQYPRPTLDSDANVRLRRDQGRNQRAGKSHRKKSNICTKKNRSHEPVSLASLLRVHAHQNMCSTSRVHSRPQKKSLDGSLRAVVRHTDRTRYFGNTYSLATPNTPANTKKNPSAASCAGVGVGVGGVGC